MIKTSVFRRFVLMWLLTGWIFGGIAQTEDYNLYLSYTDSVEVGIDLTQLRSLKFSYSTRTMTVNYRDGRSDAHDYSRIAKLYFDKATSGIEQADFKEEGEFYTLSGKTLRLHEVSHQAVLYSIGGSLVRIIIGQEISLEGVPAGVYVLRVDSRTAKICVP